jgi:hypothetical protein
MKPRIQTSVLLKPNQTKTHFIQVYFRSSKKESNEIKSSSITPKKMKECDFMCKYYRLEIEKCFQSRKPESKYSKKCRPVSKGCRRVNMVIVHVYKWKNETC